MHLKKANISISLLGTLCALSAAAASVRLLRSDALMTVGLAEVRPARTASSQATREGARIRVHVKARASTPSAVRTAYRAEAYRAAVQQITRSNAGLRAEAAKLAGIIAEFKKLALTIPQPRVVQAAGPGAEYSIEGSADLDADTVSAEMCRSAASSLKLVVALDPSGPAGQESVQASLESGLQSAGYRVYDLGVATGQGELGKEARELLQAEGDRRRAAKIGAANLSSFLVVVKINGRSRAVGGSAYSYAATATARVIRAEDGEVVYSTELPIDGSGRGVDEPQAREQALRAIGRKTALEVSRELSDRLPPSSLNLTIKGMNADRVASLQETISKLPGVISVEPHETAGAVLLSIQSREKLFPLLSGIRDRTGLEIASVTP